MKTTLVTFSPARTTWSVISAVDRLQVTPPCPVAQNGQAIPQPAWLDRQTVVRPGERIRTDSTSVPSWARFRVYLVAPSLQSTTRSCVNSSGISWSNLPLRSAETSVIWSRVCPAK